MILFSLLFVACTDSQKDDKCYVISKIEKHLQINNIEHYDLYGHYNFLLTDNKIYVHRKNNFKSYNDVINENDTLIPFLNLEIQDIFNLTDQNKIETFVSENLKDSIYSKKLNKKVLTYVIIASQYDSIKNIYFDRITKSLNSVNVKFKTIRLFTEEENAVMQCVLSKKKYNKNKVKWKSKFQKELEPPLPF